MSVTDISIRFAAPGDGRPLQRIAERDSRRLPGGRLLVADVAGELQAALSVDTGEWVADPFRPTAALVDLLRLRARQVERGPQGTKRPWTAKRVLSPALEATPSAPPS
jgi:hypothetical protein